MSMERFWQTVLVNCEALPREVLPAAAQASGKPILGTCVVVDLSGFGCVLGAWSILGDTTRLTYTSRVSLALSLLQPRPVLADEGLRTELLPGLAGLLSRNVSRAPVPYWSPLPSHTRLSTASRD